MTATRPLQLNPEASPGSVGWIAARCARAGLLGNAVLGRGLCLMMLALTHIFAHSSDSALPTRFRMGSNADESTFVGRWTHMVHREAFKRMKIPLEITVAPLKRITTMSAQGTVDGELARAPAYGATQPDMMVVDVTLMEIVFSIYTAKPIPGLKSIENVRDSNLQGAYARGVIGCENVLLPLFSANRLTSVSTATNGLSMLAAGHIDFYCDVSTGMQNALTSEAGRKGLQPHKLFDLGSKVPLNAYVNRKHSAMVPLFVATLKQMKAEGLFDRLGGVRKTVAFALRQQDTIQRMDSHYSFNAH